MSSLYLISQSLQQTFDEIEENGGELTPELEERLAIKEEALADTLVQYKNYIEEIEHRISMADAERKRIDAFKKRNNSQIDRVKNQMVTAIKKFGFLDKKGKHIIDLPTVTFTIRNSKVIDLDTHRCELLIHYLNKFFHNVKFVDNNYISLDNQQFIVDTINTYYQADTEGDAKAYNPFTLDDLLCVEFSISSKGSFSELADNGVLDVYIKHMHQFDIENVTSKSKLKDIIECRTEEGESIYNITYAKQVVNDNLVIK